MRICLLAGTIYSHNKQLDEIVEVFQLLIVALLFQKVLLLPLAVQDRWWAPAEWRRSAFFSKKLSGSSLIWKPAVNFSRWLATGLKWSELYCIHASICIPPVLMVSREHNMLPLGPNKLHRLKHTQALNILLDPYFKMTTGLCSTFPDKNKAGPWKFGWNSEN